MSKQFETRYVARDELQETFADSVEKMMFDGKLFRLELCVSRMDEPKPPAKPTGSRHPVSRIVLTTEAAIDLCNNLNRMLAAAKLAATEQKGKPN